MVRWFRQDAGETSGHTDQHLLERLREGDMVAFTEIVRTYSTRLQTYIQAHVHDSDISVDVVQDVFMQLWERRRHTEIRTTLQGYLFGSARNHLLMVLRKRRLEDRYASDFLIRDVLPGVGSPALPPDVQVERQELALALQRALDTLSPRVRQVALLRWRDKLSRAEIAEVFGVSVATIHNQLTVATRALRPLLAEQMSKLPGSTSKNPE